MLPHVVARTKLPSCARLRVPNFLTTLAFQSNALVRFWLGRRPRALLGKLDRAGTPVTESRHLYAGCHLASNQVSARFISGVGVAPDFDNNGNITTLTR